MDALDLFQLKNSVENNFTASQISGDETQKTTHGFDYQKLVATALSAQASDSNKHSDKVNSSDSLYFCQEKSFQPESFAAQPQMYAPEVDSGNLISINSNNFVLQSQHPQRISSPNSLSLINEASAHSQQTPIYQTFSAVDENREPAKSDAAQKTNLWFEHFRASSLFSGAPPSVSCTDTGSVICSDAQNSEQNLSFALYPQQDGSNVIPLDCTNYLMSHTGMVPAVAEGLLTQDQQMVDLSGYQTLGNVGTAYSTIELANLVQGDQNLFQSVDKRQPRGQAHRTRSKANEKNTATCAYAVDQLGNLYFEVPNSESASYDHLIGHEGLVFDNVAPQTGNERASLDQMYRMCICVCVFISRESRFVSFPSIDRHLGRALSAKGNQTTTRMRFNNSWSHLLTLTPPETESTSTPKLAPARNFNYQSTNKPKKTMTTAFNNKQSRGELFPSAESSSIYSQMFDLRLNPSKVQQNKLSPSEFNASMAQLFSQTTNEFTRQNSYNPLLPGFAGVDYTKSSCNNKWNPPSSNCWSCYPYNELKNDLFSAYNSENNSFESFVSGRMGSFSPGIFSNAPKGKNGGRTRKNLKNGKAKKEELGEKSLQVQPLSPKKGESRCSSVFDDSASSKWRRLNLHEKRGVLSLTYHLSHNPPNSF
ncbi:hypothetical protein Ciccas_002293 [Cichlidogyrus casuarinus]|uniref:Uncharacterized protein n=1 Tax=Cichlidogyrus casuarinus TaxID=1844966 RepID=A0ABD2QHM6_9PLAT